MVLGEFRQRYPQGSLVSKLIDIDRGIYIVKVSVIVDNITLSTGLAGRERVEIAEDAARERAIAALMVNTDNAVAVSSVENNLITAPVESSNKPVSLPIAKETILTNPTNSDRDAENSHTIDLPNYLTKNEAQPDPIVLSSEQKLESSFDDSVASQPNFKPEVTAEFLSEEVITQAQNPPIAASADLFEGTLNNNIDTNTRSNHSLMDQEYSPDPSPLLSTENLSDSENLAEINFNEIKHKTDLEIKRLGWTKDDGREFLKSRYGKRSRLQLTDNQLLEFLQYLESQPNPN
jgi:hypothetical protein